MKDRPNRINGYTYSIDCPCGKLFITCNDMPDNKLFEVFITLGKAGGCGAANKDAIGILISVGLRSGVDPKDIVKYINGIECNRSNRIVPSCISAIATIIDRHEKNKELLITED